MSKSILSDDTKAEINKYLPDALKLKIQNQIKLSKEVKMGAVKTKDGLMTIEFEGDVIAPNAPVVIKDATGLEVPVVAEAATYVSDNGDTVIVTNGVVTSITPAAPVEVEAAAPAAPVIDMSAVNAQLNEQKISFETKLSAVEVSYKTKLESALSKIKSLEDSNKVVLEFMDLLIATPVSEKKERVKLPDDFSKLSGLEKYKIRKEIQNG